MAHLHRRAEAFRRAVLAFCSGGAVQTPLQRRQALALGWTVPSVE